MTREEAIEQLSIRYLGEFDKDREAKDMAISALSTDGEYIKKSELFDKTVRRNSIWNEVTNSEGKGLEEIVNDLPTYSFPDSADIEKIRAEMQEKISQYNQCNQFNGSNTANGLRIALEIIDKHIGGKDK